MTLGGRPRTELTAEQLAEVETLAAVLTVAQMADYFGIGRTTFFSILNRDADVSERYKRGRARAVGAIAQSLVSKARAGDTTAMIFFLKTQAGWRETVEVEVETREIDGESAFQKLNDMLNRMRERTSAAAPRLPVNDPVEANTSVAASDLTQRIAGRLGAP